MKKLYFLFPVAMVAMLLVSGCNVLGTQQKETDEQPKGTQQNESSESSSRTITVPNQSVWSQQECDEAINFAQDIVDTVKGKDVEKLSRMINYPIKVDVGFSENVVDLKTKEEFSKLEFDEIFTDKMCSSIVETTELFSNQGGFMMGKGEIWFSPFDGQMKITTINYI